MKNHRIPLALLLATVFILAGMFVATVSSQGPDPNAQTNQADKVSGTGVTVDPNDPQNVANEGTGAFTFDPFKSDPTACDIYDVCGAHEICEDGPCPTPTPPEEAPTGFDDQTNGFVIQGDPITACSPGPTPGTFEADKFIFSVVDEKADGLGPVYNAQSCRECHQNPVVGGISQVTELRAGHNDSSDFVDAPGGSLINDRAIDSKVQERVPPLFSALVYPAASPTPSPSPSPSPIPGEEPVRTFRTSLNLLGDGFVEAIANGTLLAIADTQDAVTGGQVHGQAIAVPVLEANFETNRDCADPEAACIRRIGRFGWKNQIPSLLSFSGDAYLNEIGITNFLILKENTSLGRPITAFDTVADDTVCDDDAGIVCGEDTERDIDTFTEFMRATKAPPQDTDIQTQFATDVDAGRTIFGDMPNGPGYSCSVCHVPAIVTADIGTTINGGTFVVPASLGFKIIRPFGDFLLHDIGTGDGIVQNGGQPTRLKVRTPPLWGVRTRTRLLHDGSALTFLDAIQAHHGEAEDVTTAFAALTSTQKKQLIMFLESL
ncbi:MAG TPA: di-heme oxidoredictase family protein [Pyrinomonadaceae bacterium]|jgi:CxxC motif-containing protein (DUF1111 family)|nr:di-heme oxidoredictase family protein [Pyrinomonadaceae bacterium]